MNCEAFRWLNVSVLGFALGINVFIVIDMWRRRRETLRILREVRERAGIEARYI